MSIFPKEPEKPEKPEDLMELVASAATFIPDNIEYALYAYIQAGSANAQMLRELVQAYRTGNLAAARILVDALDGTIDGKLFNLPLDQANVPRMRMKRKSDPD